MEVEVEEVEVGVEEEVEEVEVGVEEEVEEVEAPRQEEQPQEEEEIRNSSEQSHLPSAEIGKMSTASCQTSWDTCPSIEITRPLRHSSPGSTSLCPLLQEKKCATGRTACAHGPIIS